MKILFSTILTLVLFSGCIFKNENHRFTSVSKPLTSNAENARVPRELLNDISKDYRLVQKDCSVSQGDWWFDVLIPLYINSTADESLVDALLEKCDGDLATNVKIQSKYFFGWVTVSYYGKTATADIWVKR